MCPDRKGAVSMTANQPRYESYLSFAAMKGSATVPAAISESVSAGNGEFEAFEDTLSKLAQVPKSEIDEQRAAR